MPNKIDVLARISPQMAAVLAKEDELAGDANDTSAGFAQMRENYVAGRAWWNEEAPEMDRVVDDAVEGPFGSIAVRRYYPCEIAEGVTEPAIVYVHGGGFVLGNLDTHDRVCRILAKRAGVPAFVIFTDVTLQNICAMMPKSEAEFLQVPGVGKAKCERYAADFLALLASYKGKNLQ